MSQKKRDIFIDILKGIGIISVVIGHSGIPFSFMKDHSVTSFVYLYHLMIFFFAAGMVYKPDNYADSYTYIGRQLKSSVPLYVGYNLAFLLLHNVFTNFHLSDASLYAGNDFVIQGLSTLVLKHTEPLAGALWFVPMFLLAKCFFAIGFRFAERRKYKLVLHAAFILLSGAIGIYTSSSGMFLHYNMQTSLLGVPIIYLGYLFQRYRDSLIKLAGPLACVLSAAGMIWFVRMQIGSVDLSQNQIISPLLFYPVTLLGLCFCLSLAGTIHRCRYGSKLVAYLGSASFHIMALHFLVFKCFDRVWGHLTQADAQTMTRFPTSFGNIGWVYTLLGITIPALLVFGGRKIKTFSGNRKKQ